MANTIMLSTSRHIYPNPQVLIQFLCFLGGQQTLRLWLHALHR